jgi:hypothetical protein
MGEACFRGSYPNSKTDVLRRKAIEAVKELLSWRLVYREHGKRSNGSQKSNNYYLTNESDWLKQPTAPSSNTRGKNTKAHTSSTEGTLGGSVGESLGVVLGEHPPSAEETLPSAGGTPLEVNPLEINPIEVTPTEENNSPDAADSSVCESENDFFEANQYEEQTGIPSFVNKEKNQATGDNLNCPKDKGSASARDNKNIDTWYDQDHLWKLEIISSANVEINKHLEKTVKKHTETEVEESVACYEQHIEQGAVIVNPQGWLTECLRGEWWKNSPFKVERRREEALILETLAAYGYNVDDKKRQAVFETYWRAVEGRVMYDFDESIYLDATRAGYFLITSEAVFVCGLNDSLEYEMINWDEFAKQV